MRIPDLSKTLFKKSPYREVGISWIKEKLIKHNDSKDLKSIHACGKKIYYKSNEELIHCLKEIFFEKIYNFKSSKTNPFIIDCGAHIGMSVLNFKQQYPNASIMAFEPDATNFELLKNNVSEWGFEDVELFQNPVWNANEEISFEASGAMGGKIAHSNGHLPATIQLRSVRLADLLTKEIDLLKIDIEGAEYEVLVDCQDKLEHVSNIFVEYHSTFDEKFKLIEILNILQQAGFEFYIKEANNVFPTPFMKKKIDTPFDLQLNIFAFRL